MQEKEIINDYLSGLNGSLAGYASIIAQTDNQELRQLVQEMRNQDEQRQYEVYLLAKQRGYYKPAQPATEEEIMTVKNELSQG
jgi:spore coat protein CotF